MNKLKCLKYILVVGIFAFVGCNDILEDPSPATSVPGEQVLTSEQGVNSLRASLYSRLREGNGNDLDYSTEYFVGPSAIADETFHRPASSRYQGLNDANGSDGGTNGLSSYSNTYSIILDANLLIGAVEDGVLDQATLNRYRGEAYAIRAMVMHHLVRVLGYEPGMIPATGEDPNFDLGIPLITEPTLDISNVGPTPRATVSDVYNQILNDLSEAKTLLSGINSDETYITEAFVDGLTARVNLYAGNWGAAATAAGNAITNSGLSLEDTQTGVAGMFDETAGGHPEAIFKMVVNPSTEPIGGSNVNNGLAAYTAEQWAAQIPTNFVIDQYDAGDYRLGWYAPCFDTFSGSAILGCDSVNDEGWELQKFNGEKGQLADDIPYMRIAEMYLIQAEAAAKADNNVASGIGPLNTLRAARNAGPAVAAVDFATLEDFEDFILEERVRELVSEGHRFFDLKRLGRDITYPDGSVKIRYDNYRLLDNIGAGLISSNPDLVENPGY